MIVVSQPFRAHALAAAFEHRDTMSIHLFKNDIVLSQFTTEPELVEADYPGYAALGLPENTDVIFDPVTGRTFLAWSEKLFQRTTSGLPQTIYGYYVLDDDYQPVWSERFFSPQDLTNAGDAFKIRPRVYLWSHPNSM